MTRSATMRSPHTLVVRAGQMAITWYAAREWLIVGGAAIAIITGLVIAGFMCLHRPGPSRPAALATATASEPWTYLLVCSACDYRARFPTHPAQFLPRQGPTLRCPQCGEYAAAAYRRGGQTLPPGGWYVDDANTDSPAAPTGSSGEAPP